LQVIPNRVLRFAEIIQETTGYACIAGSAPLVKFVREARESAVVNEVLNPRAFQLSQHATNGDVDIFVPTWPQHVGRCADLYLEGNREEYSKCVVMREEKMEWELHPLNGIIRELHPMNAIIKKCSRENIEVTIVDLFQPSFSPHMSRVSLVNVRVSHIYNVTLHELVHGRRKHVPARVQVIFVSSLPQYGQSWARYITSTFDIDVCKCTIEVTGSPNGGKVKLDEGVLESVMAGVFVYEVQPCKPFLMHLMRIFKYLRKGFVLKAIQFHPMCGERYKEYVTGRFQHFFAYKICHQALISLGMNEEMANQLGGGYVAKYLNNVSKVQDDKRLMDCIEEDSLRIAGNMYWPEGTVNQQIVILLGLDGREARKQKAMSWLKAYRARIRIQRPLQKRRRVEESSHGNSV
jgi:hypothetical protein